MSKVHPLATSAALAAVLLVMGLAAWNGNGQEKDKGEAGTVQLGPNASLGGRRAFPDDNLWNKDISQSPVDAHSDRYIASIGTDAPLHPDFGPPYHGEPNGIPYVVVPGKQKRVPVTFRYASDSDPGPYPIPADAPIEGGPNAKEGDRHVLIIDRDNWMLYELFAAERKGNQWHAGSGAIFDMKVNKFRPAGLTSADAAGLPVFPGLVRYDEVFELKEIRHALRFTAKRTRKAYVHPARHYASNSRDPNRPPMGMRVRLKADYDISGFSANAQIILKALKKYGMFLADNGGNWYFSGVPDDRWDNEELATLKRVKGKDFEVIQLGRLVTQ